MPDPTVDPSTISYTKIGQLEIVSFSDLDGNDYRIEGRYDSSGRLSELKSFLNDTLLGIDRPTWSGTNLTGNRNESSNGAWVEANATFQPIAWGGVGSPDECSDPGPADPDEPIEPSEPGEGDLDPCGVEMQSVVIAGVGEEPGDDECRDALIEYAWEAVTLLAAVGAYGGTALMTGGGSVLATGVAAVHLGRQMWNWYGAMRELEKHCTRNTISSDPNWIPSSAL